LRSLLRSRDPPRTLFARSDLVPSVTRAPPNRATHASSVCLSAPLGRGGKMLLTDLCNQPTTRAPDGPFDFRAPWLAPPSIAESFAGVSQLLPRDARPPCGNPAPARTRLTARRRASKALIASCFRSRPPPVDGGAFPRVSDTAVCVHHPAPACFGRSAGSTSVSLTPLSPATTRRPSGDGVQTTGHVRFHRSHVNATDLPERGRLPSTSALRRVLSHVAVG